MTVPSLHVPRRVRTLAVAAALVSGVAATGCSSSSPSSFEPGPLPTPPGYQELVAKANLDPCPATTADRVKKSLPPLTLPCLGRGPAVEVAGLRGKPTVVNIWGTWCTPCQKETRYLATVYDANKRTVRFLGVDTEDSAASALDFAPHVQPPMRYPQVFDSGKKLLIALRLPSAVPTTLFVDAAGHLVHVSHGDYHSADALRRDMRRYLDVTVA